MIKKRISERQAIKSARQANKNRQYAHGSIPRFVSRASEIVDLFAKIVEKNMDVPAGQGLRGSRVQPYNVDIGYVQAYDALRRVLEGEEEE